MTIKKTGIKAAIFISAFGILTALSATAWADGLSGAIFTTDNDGDIVNQNLYQQKTDVYLNGGPGPHAPLRAAKLPEGCYVFQVTDPSGKTLLSTDSIRCRTFHVNSAGYIDSVGCSCGCPGTTSCAHATGIDTNDAAQGGAGAITVQLYPFSDTPNPGGVYKVWITPCSKLMPPDTSKNSFGFVPAWSKTDNFKVVCTCACTDSSVITVRAFYDSNNNGVLDAGDKEIGVKILTNKGGRGITITDPMGVVNSGYTPSVQGPLASGNYLVSDDGTGTWKDKAVYVDGNAVSGATSSAVVQVTGSCGETHEVTFLVH